MSVEESNIDQELGAFGEEEAAGLPDAARRALTTLLTARFITRARNRQAWDSLLAYEHEIRERLSDLFLELVVDRDLEVAFKRQMLAEDAPRVLRRERPLSRDASFLLVFLRQECAYTDAADGPVVVNRAQLEEFLRAYREEGDGDAARFERRVDTAIRALTELRLLTADPDAGYLFTVSPVVVPLIGADELIRLEDAYRQGVELAEPPRTDDRTDGEIAE
ncbi:DUF4194 domain-containing protein [Amycolatopsis tolypomycina]|uniref:DUF4194 domain-containing protein n=1 Tax=Amycolatopsis tolypomycina TaxID=208445 RepID=UPI00339EBA49